MASKPRPSSATTTQIKKPLRPLSAYHLFFKLEREYIIQTLSGPDVAGDSVHAEKWRLRDVPHRYGHIRLPLGWYLGPGKGRKRRHRRSHGKIGFFELSHAISKRWAALAMTDPETKRYVAGIAAREMGQYTLEMKEYKELTQLQSRGDATGLFHVTATSGAVISPNVSPHPTSTYHPADVASSTVFPPTMPCFQDPMQLVSTEIPATLLSLEQAPAVREEEIDYSICRVSNSGYYIPSPGPLLNRGKSNTNNGAICDPLFELEEEPLVPCII